MRIAASVLAVSRILATLVAVLFFALALIILLTRYVILPNIDGYRTHIEAAAARALGAPVKIGDIDASWYRLNPRLRVHDARILGPEGDVALLLPTADALISWRSLLFLQPEVIRLQLTNPDLQVRRDTNGHFWVGGIQLQRSADDGRRLDESPFLRWVLRQRSIEIVDARLDWVDETQRFPEFHAPDVDVAVRRGFLGVTRFALQVNGATQVSAALQVDDSAREDPVKPHNAASKVNATPQANPPAFEHGAAQVNQTVPPDTATGRLPSVDVRGEVRQALGVPGADDERLEGRLYIALQDADLAELGAWSDDSLGEWQGRAAGRVWVDLHRSRPAAWSGELVAENFGYVGVSPRPSLQAQSLRLSLRGDGTTRQASGTVFLRNGGVDLSRFFELGHVPLHALDADGQVQWSSDGGVRLDVKHLVVDAGEPGARAQASAQGSWHTDKTLPFGYADLNGSIQHGEAGAVSRFMPDVVDEDVRQWLRDGLPVGTITGGTWRVRGDLDDFPFDEVPPDAGEFMIDGAVSGLTVNLAPDVTPGWPRLQNLDGRIVITQAEFMAQVEQGQVDVKAEPVVRILPAKLHIPNLRIDPVLTVTGQFEGGAQGFLHYVQTSPINDYTNALLSRASASGTWHMPLKVVAPLARLDDIKVEGEVALRGGSIRIEPDTPQFTQLNGVLRFTQAGVSGNDLRAHVLGGPITASGHTYNDGGGEVAFHGQTAAKTWSEIYNAPGMRHIQGSASYQGKLVVPSHGGPVSLEIESPLEGLALTLPAPLNKPAEARWPLRVELKDPSTRSSREPVGPTLDLTLNDAHHAVVQLGPVAPGQRLAHMQRGAVGLGHSAQLPKHGLDVNVQTNRFDLDAWHEVIAEFAVAEAPHTRAGRPSRNHHNQQEFDLVHMPLQASFQAQRLDVLGRRLNDANMKVTGSFANALNISVQAQELAGDLTWQPAVTRDTPHEHVTAQLSRLHIPRPEAQASGAQHHAVSDADDGVPETMPDIDLAVADLRYGNWALGRMEVEGRNAGDRWQVRRLQLENPDGQLNAHGEWARLPKGKERVMHLELDWNVRDAGDLLGRFGMPGIIDDGAGHLRGSVEWQGKPFAYDLPTLTGHFNLALERGRFLKVNSNASRLLGILSLQSLARMATFASGSLFESGFAWDTLRSEVAVDDGLADIRHLEMKGPSAFAALAGTANLINETQSLKAVVVPNIDASAAALLAGIAINPAVGLGAFLTQWLLREPLAHALTYEYDITGTWSDPHVKRTREPVSARSNIGEEPNY